MCASGISYYTVILVFVLRKVCAMKHSMSKPCFDTSHKKYLYVPLISQASWHVSQDQYIARMETHVAGD